MKNLFYIFAFLFCLSCSTKRVEGIYKSKYRELDVADFYINLNCDGTAYTIYKENAKQDSTKGKWIKYQDTLVITYDSVRYQNHPSQKLMYKIKNNSLHYLALTETTFKLTIQKMKAEGLSDTLKLKKYEMFDNVKTYNKYINRTPIDFKNTFRNQVYKKQINFRCY